MNNKAQAKTPYQPLADFNGSQAQRMSLEILSQDTVGVRIGGPYQPYQVSPIKPLSGARCARLLQGSRLNSHRRIVPLHNTTMADDQEECKHRGFSLCDPSLTYVGSTDANEAVEISIIQAAAGSPKTLSTFHPRFTYPIFGEEERIFGYQGLRIILRFSAHLLRPNIEILHDKKFKAVGDTKAQDIEGTLREWTPESG